jgi:septal ring factor EnvC (AmiA/AmiB activator)
MILLALVAVSTAFAQSNPSSWNQKLEQVKTQKLAIEKALIEAEATKKNTEAQLSRLKSLQKLQAQEKELTSRRLADLERYLIELKTRRDDVQRRIDQTHGQLRVKFSKLIHPVLSQNERLMRGEEGAGEARVKEVILSSIVLSELKELESMHADLLDVDELQGRIEQEKQQISSLLQDISEQESLITFHKKIRSDLTSEKHSEHMKQLDDYRKIKVAEVEIEKMIIQFHGRQKMEQAMDERKRMVQVQIRPKSLPWPMKGKVVSTYGQQKDEKSGLNIFKKGIEIQTLQGTTSIQSVADGTVQFSGAIPGKGNVVIVEHPGLIYTVYGGLQNVIKQAGQLVKASENLGTIPLENSLYFEIRVRNVAIDPVKWLQ